MITRRNFIKKSLLSTTLATITLNNTELMANTSKNIKTPMLKTNGVFKEISWKRAFDIIEKNTKNALKESGVNGIGLYTNGNISIEESYALNKFFKAGFRSNNISTSSYNNEEIALKSRVNVYGIDGVSGTFDDLINTDYAILFDTDIENVKHSQKLNYINITSSYKKSNKAYLNINIKDSAYSYIINYIINEKLKNISNEDMIYLKKHFVFANFKDNLQWEISFKNYKKSFSKYTLEYVSKYIKLDEKEDINEFQSKLIKLKNLFEKKDSKLISITSSIFNKSNKSLKSNQLLQSIHLLTDKHSRPGCGVFNIASNISQGSLDDVGLYSNRLPANMYIKYKKHRTKAENIFNIAKGTLNPVSYNHNEFINNINANITKLLWIINDNSNFINDIKNKDLFIISSSNYINYDYDLILPTAISTQRNSITISEDRMVKYHIQEKIPNNLAMSLIWQTLEFSKRISFKDVYKKVKIDNKQALKNVLDTLIIQGYSKDDKLFKILFNNPKLRLFNKSYGLNSEMNGDNRMVIGSDGGIFLGYRYNIQEYLFNEFRQFTLQNAHDLSRYKTYVNSNKSLLYPIVNNKSIKYRFNPIDDVYAKKSLKDNRKFSFYGKMGEKNLPFGNLEKITNKKENKKTFKYRAKLFTCHIEE